MINIELQLDATTEMIQVIRTSHIDEKLIVFLDRLLIEYYHDRIITNSMSIT